MKWGSTGHPNTIDPDILPRLKECGCTYLEIGGESADNRILKEIKKNKELTIQEAIAISLAKKIKRKNGKKTQKEYK